MRIFIAGTDTGVGKTFISAQIMKSWAEKKPAYYKPIQTGSPSISEAEDLLAIQTLTQHSFDSSLFCGLCLSAPMSPLQAARHVGITIDPSSILLSLKNLVDRFEHLVVEGSGGLMVPITENFFMIDLIEQSALPTILVTRPTLGTINHTLLSLDALKARHIPILGFIMNQFPVNPTLAETESVAMIETLGNVPCLDVVTLT